MNVKANELITKIKLDLTEDNELQNFFYTLWEGKYVLLITTLLVSLIATTYILLRPAKYQANTLIQVSNKSSDEKLHLPMFSMGGSGSETASQIALIKSRVILEPIINQLGLSFRVEPIRTSIFGHFGKKQKSTIDISHLQLPPKYLQKKLKLKITDVNHFVLTNPHHKILLQGETNQLVQKGPFALRVDKMKAMPGSEFYLIKYPVLDVLKQLSIRLNVEELGDPNNNQTGILQITLTDTDPHRMIHILNSIGKAIEKKDAERKLQESQKTLQFLNEQLPIIKSSLIAAEEKLNAYRAKSGKINIKIQAQQLMEQAAETEKQIVEAVLYRSNLLEIYTPQYPLVVELNNKINELKRLKQILLEKIKSLPASDQIAVNLMRDVKVKNDLYLVLLNKIQELQIVNSGTLSDIKILAEAQMPETAQPEPISLLIAASLVLGLMLGCIAVFTRNVFSRRVNDPQWVEKKFSIPNLAVVPFSKIQKTNKTKKRDIKFLPILAEKSPRDLSVEALRNLRSSLQVMLNNTNKKVIAVMGLSTGVGKSFVCINFAYLLANAEKKVLLIDGDIRRGDLYKYLSLPQAPGLNELLTERVTLSEAIQSTSLSNLSFISCGKYPDNPSELLMKKNFEQVLETVSQQYEYVIIDTAPLLAAPDTIIIGSLTDINFLVIGGNKHHPEEIVLTIKQLENASIKVHGTIFNNLSQKPLTYGNYRYQYYSYYSEPTLN